MDDLFALEPEWYEVFPDYELAMGFEIGPDQVPLLKECIQTKTTKPLEDYLANLPTDRVY